jgi:hypothetical protein
VTMIARSSRQADHEWTPVGAAAREAGILREYLVRALQRGQIPFERVDGRLCVKIVHARLVKAWRAKQFQTWEGYQSAVKATGEAA